MQSMRSLVIALKYGYLTATERGTIFGGAFAEAFAVLAKVQVLSSYLRPSPELYIVELERLGFWAMRPYGSTSSHAQTRALPLAALSRKELEPCGARLGCLTHGRAGVSGTGQQ